MIDSTTILSMAGSVIALCGVAITALITRGRGKNGIGSGSGTNGIVRVATCEAKHEGLNKSLDSLWIEFRELDNKMDRLMMHFKIEVHPLG